MPVNRSPYRKSHMVAACSAGTAIGGYTASVAGGAVASLPGANNDAFTFYWVDSGNSRQMTYTYEWADGQTSSATVTFYVYGPTSPTVTAQVGTTQIRLMSGNIVVQSGGTPTLKLGGVNVLNTGGTAGIVLTAASTLPILQGVYSWVQLLDESSEVELLTSGSQRYKCPLGPQATLPWLDNSYPYDNSGNAFTQNVQNDTVIDIPKLILSDNSGSNYGEGKYYFLATMYLLWNPNTANSIPVPLANIQWSWAGDAINTLVTQPNYGNTTFIQGCGQQNGSNPCHVTVPASDPGNGYPQWDAAATNNFSLSSCSTF